MSTKVFSATSLIGFDRLLRGLQASVEEQRAQSYPPYNLVRTGENEYKIIVALAGFRRDEITIELEENVLNVSGSKSDERSDFDYIHRGLSFRNFTRKFQLADLIEVRSAAFEDGLLSITFERVVPEAQQKRTIPINASAPALEDAS